MVKEGGRRADPLGVGDPTADLLRAAAGTRCPSCAATLRAGAPWCTLCYADLRPRPEPEPEPEPVPAAPALAVPVVAAYGLPAVDPLATAPAGPAAAPADPVWPCATCGVANPLTVSSCAACGAGFLAALRDSESPLLELPVVGDLGAMSRAQRLGLAFGAVLVVLALVLVLGLLFS